MKEFALILLVGIFCSCEKPDSSDDSPSGSKLQNVSAMDATDKPPADKFLYGPQTLMESLVGTYEGYWYKKHEYIDCPTCAPPCNFNYTYDSTYVYVLVDSVGEGLLSITDTATLWVSRTLSIDSTLYY